MTSFFAHSAKRSRRLFRVLYGSGDHRLAFGRSTRCAGSGRHGRERDVEAYAYVLIPLLGILRNRIRGSNGALNKGAKEEALALHAVRGGRDG